MTKYTEQQVREFAESVEADGDNRMAGMLTAFADLLAAQPVAVPDAGEALDAAIEWISNVPHGDNCYLDDSHPSYPGQCHCGKDSILSYLLDVSDGQPAAALQDVPLEIQQALSKVDMFDLYEESPAAEGAKEPTYSSTQATKCAGCGQHKHTPLRIDAMGGYVCLTCIDKELERLLAHSAEGAKAAQPCKTCNGVGMVGGHVGQTPESFDYVSEPCPDCTPPSAQPAEVLSDDPMAGLSEEHMEFFRIVCAMPGYKLNGGQAWSKDGAPLWEELERRGLIESVGSYKWRNLTTPEVLKDARIAKLETALAQQQGRDAGPVAYLHYAKKKPSERLLSFNPRPTIQQRARGWVSLPLCAAIAASTKDGEA